MKIFFFFANNDNLNMLMKKLRELLIKHFLGNEEDKRPDFLKACKGLCLNKGILNAKDIGHVITF